jgi:hypothetical protein
VASLTGVVVASLTVAVASLTPIYANIPYIVSASYILQNWAS